MPVSWLHTTYQQNGETEHQKTERMMARWTGRVSASCKLAADNEVLRVAKGERVRLQVGHYFVLDLEIGGILHQDVDPEALARELGVLRDYEEVVE
jgi:hypothetical protein